MAANTCHRKPLKTRGDIRRNRRPFIGGLLLRLLRPARACSLAGTLGSFGCTHALCGLGPTMLPTTHRTILDHYQLGFRMDSTMLCHRIYTLPLVSMIRNAFLASSALALPVDAHGDARFGFSTQASPFPTDSEPRAHCSPILLEFAHNSASQEFGLFPESTLAPEAP